MSKSIQLNELIAENDFLRQKVATLETEKETLRKSRFVTNAADQLLTLIDRNYIYETVNEAYCQAHGQEREDLVGKTVSQVWGAELFEATIKSRIDACFSGVITRAEDWFSFSGTESRYYQVTYHPYKDDNQYVSHVAVVTHDITDRKRAEIAMREENGRLECRVRERTLDLEDANRRLRNEVEERKRIEKALRDSEARYRSVSRDMPAMVCRFLPDGRLTFANQRFCAHCQILEKDFGNVNIFSFVPANYGLGIKKRLETLTPENSMVTSEEPLPGTEGEDPVWYQWTDHALFDDHGTPVEYQSVGIDITEKKNADEKRLYAQKMEMLGSLSGGIAHDFNNLLMGIQGSVSLMGLKIKSPHPFEEDLETIGHLVSSGSDLTRQLLGFSRRRTSLFRSLDMNVVVSETAQLFKRTRKAVRIHETYAERIPMILADRGQLEQMLLNLFLNAWQAMSEKGDLYLSTDHVAIDENFVRPYTVSHGNYIRLSIKDTGSGIDPAIAPYIFDPFFTTKKSGSGTGLGLASAYNIVKAHGGIIDFETRPGKGVTFDIYLPVSEKREALATPEPPRLLCGQEKILLVDDESYIVDVGTRMLQELGYSVITADHGEMAVHAFRHAEPPVDLVILNMVMPDMDGTAVLQALRDIRPDIRILLTSGYGIRNVASLMNQKETGFIQKPYTLETLSMAIRSLIDTGHYAPAP